MVPPVATSAQYALVLIATTIFAPARSGSPLDRLPQPFAGSQNRQHIALHQQTGLHYDLYLANSEKRWADLWTTTMAMSSGFSVLLILRLVADEQLLGVKVGTPI